MKNNNTKYDIFISYRRASYDTANLIATGMKIKNLQDLSTAYKANDKASVKILRLDEGSLKEVIIPQIKDVDVVGFVGLTE